MVFHQQIQVTLLICPDYLSINRYQRLLMQSHFSRINDRAIDHDFGDNFDMV